MGAAVAGGMSVVGGAYNMIQGAKQKRDAQNALENYKRQELNNVAETYKYLHLEQIDKEKSNQD